MKKNNNTEKDVKNMPSSSKPRIGGPGGTGRTAVGTAPMSERQQMQILLQMTSNTHEAELSPEDAKSRQNSEDVIAKSRQNTGNTSKSRERTNERGETALHIAAKKGDHDAVKKLLDQGNNPNVTDFAGWTPLHEACNHGHYNIALGLIKAGASINATGLDDDTPLHDAAIFGQLKLVKMLVERGADPTFRNQKGKMPCDVASAAVYNYLVQAKDAALGRSSLQQSKKPNESKQKTISSDNDDNTGSNLVTINNKEEDDIYEFKSTPKDCSSSDEKSDAGSCKNEKSDDKASQEVDPLSTPGPGPMSKKDTENTAKGSDNIVKVKRPYSDLSETTDENIGAASEEDNKRKKRKDSDPVLGKDGGKGSNGSSRGQPRQEKSSKTGGSSKNLNLANKTILERKSPCASPKPTSTSNAPGKTENSDVEVEDKNSDTTVNPGPKVPPLKIVIPQQSSGVDAEVSGSSRNGKNASARNHAALPYVVASNNSNDSNVDKESTSSRSASPMDTKSTDEKGGKPGDERSQPRVLRSSHRGGSTVDRSSNNSSPQLQNSASPSPASKKNVNDDDENTPTSGKKSPVNNNAAASPNTGNQGGNTDTETTGANPKSPPNAPTTSNASTSSSSNAQGQQSSSGSSSTSEAPVHPRKRKIKTSKDQSASQSSSGSQASSSDDKKEGKEENSESEVHPHDQPITNCYQMFLNIRRQIEKRRKGLYPVQPKPPQGFKDYLLNRCTYALHGKAPTEPGIQYPTSLPIQMKDLFSTQEKERHKLKMQHIVEKEKLVLAVEQEILRVHGRAARALANQSLPFSVCTILKDEEVYNIITPEQEEKDRNARFRYNGRLFLSWLQDVDDKWEKIKEAMLLRHHNEAESLHAVQKMDWEWKLKEFSLCELKAKPVIEENHVPIVIVGDDFDLLPA